ncbi:unnamed protein product [Moneuplotes crassus]|uniref:non-specific serine/threonine protein kinase n=1 Tax=Euplotes crassus TaxID=5936 RepID=A0AAD1Y5A7_EUPCR|nr:unnamed protein product [Moneuplotes crassus]
MGNSNPIGCCTSAQRSETSSYREEASILDKTSSGLPKVNQFKKKTKILTIATRMERNTKLDILNDALADMAITEEPIKHYYKLGEVMGAGKYGVVKAGTSLSKSCYKVAVKVIKLEKLKSQYHSIVQEVLALKKIDHPNVVKILEIFKDKKKLYIVMELVEGMELFEFVVSKSMLSEKEARKITTQLLKTIKYLGECNICHRDLKPENIIINPDTLKLKIIDFGLSAFYEQEKLSTKVGTPYYVAPEVLDKCYGKECDLWSLGVITYVLLSGCPPFQAKTLPELFVKIRSCDLKYINKDFKNLSQSSKDFIKGLLTVDPKERMTADEALQHQWIIKAQEQAPELNDRVISKLARYRTPDILKKEIFNLLLSNIQSEVIQEWNQLFETLDVKNTGCIRIKELIELLGNNKKFKKQLKQLKKLDKKAPELEIHYSDFLLRIVDVRKEIKAKDIANAFFHLDGSKNGKISAEDLHRFLKRRGDEFDLEECKDMIRKAEEKLLSLSADHKKNNTQNDTQDDTQAGELGQTEELDYKDFKTYLIAPSLESTQTALLQSQSSIRISEYKAFDRESPLDLSEEDCQNIGLLKNVEHIKEYSQKLEEIPAGNSCKDDVEFKIDIMSQESFKDPDLGLSPPLLYESNPSL